MLDDTQRKILRILYSLYQQKWVRPDIVWISRLSQRPEGRVRHAIKGLRATGYVEIADGKMRIIRPVEHEPEKPAQVQRLGYSYDRWMD